MANEWMQQLLGNGPYHHLVTIAERDQARKWAIRLKRERDELQAELDRLQERRCETCRYADTTYFDAESNQVLCRYFMDFRHTEHYCSAWKKSPEETT